MADASSRAESADDDPRFPEILPGSTMPAWYPGLLASVSDRIWRGQHRALAAANQELLSTYWNVGRDILERQSQQGWGSKVIDRLSTDLGPSSPTGEASRHATSSTCGRSRQPGPTEQSCKTGLHNCPGTTRSRSWRSYPMLTCDYGMRKRQ